MTLKAGLLKPLTPRSPPKQRDPLTPKRIALVKAMVHDGLTRNEAAKATGMSLNAAINAFHEPAVRQFFNAELDVLRTGERARNIHTGIELRDTATGRVRLDAAKWLHGESDRGGGTVVNVGVQVTPGYIVNVGAPSHEVAETLRLAGSTKRAPESDESF